MTLAEKLAAIKERLDGVTPGPWWTNPNGTIECNALPRHGIADPTTSVAQVFLLGSFNPLEATVETDANAAYIASLDPQTVAAIIARYERMEKALEEIAGWLVPEGRDAQSVAIKALGGNDD